jgi:hypothetical protein
MTKVPFGSSEEGRLMDQDMARSRGASHDDTAGTIPPAGGAGRAAQRYEVRPRLRILVGELEALDRTPVIDIKPVLDPVAER